MGRQEGMPVTIRTRVPPSPCPFCGRLPSGPTCFTDDYGDVFMKIWCAECNADMVHYVDIRETRKEAEARLVRLWNTRRGCQ